MYGGSTNTLWAKNRRWQTMSKPMFTVSLKFYDDKEIDKQIVEYLKKSDFSKTTTIKMILADYIKRRGGSQPSVDEVLPPADTPQEDASANKKRLRQGFKGFESHDWVNLLFIKRFTNAAWMWYTFVNNQTNQKKSLSIRTGTFSMSSSYQLLGNNDRPARRSLLPQVFALVPLYRCLTIQATNDA